MAEYDVGQQFIQCRAAGPAMDQLFHPASCVHCCGCKTRLKNGECQSLLVNSVQFAAWAIDKCCDMSAKIGARVVHLTLRALAHKIPFSPTRSCVSLPRSTTKINRNFKNCAYKKYLWGIGEVFHF